jgi:hypothetical protein
VVTNARSLELKIKKRPKDYWIFGMAVKETRQDAKTHLKNLDKMDDWLMSNWDLHDAWFTTDKEKVEAAIEVVREAARSLL